MDCDAVVIGAGPNGLTLATRLQRAGVATVVVEREAVVGGQCRTETPALPGFLFHPHATFLNYTACWSSAPELGMPARLRLVTPEVQHGIAFADGRPGLVLHRLDRLDETHASIARYSAADADAFVELRHRAKQLSVSIARVMYTAPSPAGMAEHLTNVESAYRGLGVTAGLGSRTARTLIDDIFATPEVRTLMYLLIAEFGVGLHERGGDAAFLGTVLWLVCGRALPVGGMQTVTDSLAATAASAGVRLVTDADVQGIRTDSGRVSGVQLADGRTISAPVVASGAGLADTLLRLAEPDLPAASAAEIRAYDRQPGTVMTALQFCLTEPPNYRSARYEPDLNRSAQVFVGLDDPDAVLDQLAAVDAGQLPRPAGSVHITSLYDPSQAPAGHAVASVNTAFPSADQLSDTEQSSIRRAYPEAFRQRWAEYAPSMASTNVVGSHFGPFSTADRQILLRTGHDQYRSPIPGLYLCGASTYPGGGVHGACGHNAFAAIAADLHLPAGSPRNHGDTDADQTPPPQLVSSEA